MKKLGLIGGLSWYSTIKYYQIINEIVNKELGYSNSANLIINSLNLQQVKTLQENNQWKEIQNLMIESANQLEKAGAECIIICSNTPHKVADGIINNINIPFIHIADSTVIEVRRNEIKKVALLGTSYTLNSDFYKSKLNDAGIELIVPNLEDAYFIHQTIFTELTFGIVTAKTKKRYIEIINSLSTQGAEGVIFGCTEISLSVKQGDINIKIFDTTEIHANAAAD